MLIFPDFLKILLTCRFQKIVWNRRGILLSWIPWPFLCLTQQAKGCISDLCLLSRLPRAWHLLQLTSLCPHFVLTIERHNRRSSSPICAVYIFTTINLGRQFDFGYFCCADQFRINWHAESDTFFSQWTRVSACFSFLPISESLLSYNSGSWGPQITAEFC